LVIQIVGFTMVGVAVYVVGWSLERGQPIGSGDLKVENWLIGALALLMVVVAVRNAWSGLVSSGTSSPWDRGLFEMIDELATFALLLLLMTLLGLVLVLLLVVVGESAVKPRVTVVLSVGLVIVATTAVLAFLLRKLGGSYRKIAMPLRLQQRMLTQLGSASGSWITISIEPVVEIEPPLAFSVSIWVKDGGWYWRPGDAYSLARYHLWAANHTRTPDPAMHSQRVSVWAGDWAASRRGMRITKTTRRLWWIDAWRSHRDEPKAVYEVGSPEQRADLVHIGYEELKTAGLIVEVEAAKAIRLAALPVLALESTLVP
jgi:hypothetical protein